VHLHYVPEALPFAPRPVPGELRTGWLHRVAAANGITFLELLAAWATRLPADIPATVWVDDTLPPTMYTQLAAWCRLDPAALMMLDVSRRYPLAAADVWAFNPDLTWHAQPLTLEPSVRLAFCAHCCREQCHRGEPVHIRAEWALAWLTHCPRHRTWLLNDCFRCMRTDVLDFSTGRLAQLVCRFCGASVDVAIASPESASLDDVFRLERDLLECAQGEAVDAAWVGPCPPVIFLQLIRDLLTLLVSVDADGRTVLAEYLPDRGWEYPRLSRRRARRWAWCAIGERLSLMGAVVAVLRAPRRRAAARRPLDDPFKPLWAAMSTTQRDTLRQHARHWPPSIRRRLMTVIRRST
jgi:hypothetical protein